VIVAVFGASGYVGRAVTDRLLAWLGRDSVRPVVRSYASVWHFLPRGILPCEADLLSLPSIERALAGVTHVVNCARGDADAMTAGLRNLIRACRKSRIVRLIHISSTAVYGEPPHPASWQEDAPTQPKRGTYGYLKLRQDQLLQRAGLPVVLLCPPHVVGPESVYLLRVIQSLATDTFPLLNHGTAPWNTVDRRNLAYAVELALLHAEPLPRQRIFITDDGALTWADALRCLASLVPSKRPVLLNADEAEAALHRSMPRKSLSRALAHLVSGEVRAVLRKDPLLAAAERFATRVRKKFLGATRLGQRGSSQIPRVSSPKTAVSSQFLREQLRTVRPSCRRAQELLGYRPLVTAEQSLQDFCEWFRKEFLLGSPWEACNRMLLKSVWDQEPLPTTPVVQS
jgi:nucleoside-diphosphate-sugar epimerase